MNIAVWGDSMVPPLAANLQVLVPERTVFDGAGIGENSTQVSARQMADTARRGWVSVFWMGHNNVLQPQQTKADLAASIASLGHDRFVILSMVNEDTPAGRRGGIEYNTIVQLNSELAALYLNNFLDVRNPLVALYDPSQPQDVIDHGNDVPPSSVRYDEIHLRNAGSVLVATLVRNFIVGHGW